MDATVEDGLAGVLSVALASGEAVLAARGALVDHTGGVRVERAREGELRTVADATREREHLVRVTASREATARFAPRQFGEVVACGLTNPVSVVQGGFLAASDGVRVGAGRAGDAPSRGEGLFLTALSGDGRAFFAGRGRVERESLGEGEERVASAAHVLGFEECVDVSVERTRASSDAEPVVRFTGPGVAWLQTRPRTN